MEHFFENDNQIKLKIVKRTNEKILEFMKLHYSKPNGFVGRNICYLIEYNNYVYGAIVGGSATLHLPGRDDFFSFTNKNKDMLSIVNNIFFHVEPHKETSKYPIRNFTFSCLKIFVKTISKHWEKIYGNKVLGFESLVELPRTGEIYKRNGWTEVGTTVGFTCKRVSGKGTDNWSGKRIWNTTELKPKRVFCLRTN